MFYRIGLAALAILSLTAISAHTGKDDPAQAGEATKPPEVQVRGPIVGTAQTTDFEEAFAVQQEVDAYLATVNYLNIQHYYNLLEEHRRWLESLPKPAPPVRRSSGVVVTGDCAKVAAVVGHGTVMRESGGNPGATNGIYLGCAQIGTPWWNGACSGLSWTNTDDQAKCAQIVMDIQGPSAWRGTYSP